MKTLYKSFAIILMTFVTPIFAAQKITPQLADAIAEAEQNGNTVEAVIIMKEQYPILELKEFLDISHATLPERAYTVITELQQHARKTQADLLNYLESKRSGDVASYQNFWISNFIALEAKPSVFKELEKRNDISRMDQDVELKLPEPVEEHPSSPLPGHAEVGLKVINAHKMWELGFTSQGVIVMNLDSGVDGNHPALAARWRGTHVPWQHAWFDPVSGTTFPMALGGTSAPHGTSVMGVITGLDPATLDTIGVAWEAEWIAAYGGNTLSSNLAGLQWALDPDGNPATTDDMPVVLNDSWTTPSGGPCTPWSLPAIIALETAGVAYVAAGGNSGPAAGTITSPGTVNLTEMIVFSVGAIDGNLPGWPIAPWSSRGPTSCSGAGNQIKPEVCAPGSHVRTSRPGSNYVYTSGTSFAAPHVCGAVAMLKQAFPDKSGEELKQMLYDNARDLGVPGEDNDYGMGVIDVYQAYLANAVPRNPTPPNESTIYSDYTTPSSVGITWSDPTHLVNGDTLANFEIHIWRDSQYMSSVQSGIENYVDSGLNDGQQYLYKLQTRDINTDSLSLLVGDSVYAGGSPYPASPSNINANLNGTNVILNWQDPTTQSDGTPLDDLAKIYIYCEDILIDSVLAGTETYTDTPSILNTTLFYHLRAVDSEVPPKLSEASEKVPCFIGISPDFLVWVGPDAWGPTIASGDSIFEALAANGKGVFFTNNLFEFGTDLDIYKGIFVLLGVYWYDHMLGNTEGVALNTYLYNGGRIYLESADAYNYYPSVGGYNVRPWFDLMVGPDGGSDVFGIIGQNDLSNFSFLYNGPNAFMDVLLPQNSIPIWQNDSNENICGVFYNNYGTGKSIGVVPCFGGLVDSGHIINQMVEGAAVKKYPDLTQRLPRPPQREFGKFIKKFAPKSEPITRKSSNDQLLKFSENGIHITANSKAELMTAYLALFGSPTIQNTTTNLSYLVPGVDTLIVNTEIVDPDTVVQSVEALIESFDHTIRDTLSLYDDGYHHDGAAGDGIFGGTWQVLTGERSYSIGVHISTVSAGYTSHNVATFTTVGPLVLENYQVIQVIPTPTGYWAGLSVAVRNNSTNTAVNNVDVELKTDDPTATILSNAYQSFGNIGAGQISVSPNLCVVKVDDHTLIDTINFMLHIYSDGYLFWQDSSDVIVGIEVAESQIPTVFSLYQNYPNPFNPTTTIRYDLPKTRDVLLKIYNILGQEVVTLVGEKQSAGQKTVVWDGHNRLGQAVGSGIYIYRIEAGQFIQSRKMILMK